MSDYIDYDLENVGIISNVFRVSHIDLVINGKEIEFSVTGDMHGDVSVEVDDSDIEYLRENLADVEFEPCLRNNTFSVKTGSFIDYIHDFVTEAMNNGDID